MRIILILFMMAFLFFCSCSSSGSSSDNDLNDDSIENDESHESHDADDIKDESFDKDDDNENDDSKSDDPDNNVDKDSDDSDSNTAMFTRQTVTWGAASTYDSECVIKIDNDNKILVISPGAVIKFNPDFTIDLSIEPTVPEDIIPKKAYGSINAKTGTVDKDGNIFFTGRITITPEEDPFEDYNFIMKYKHNQTTAQWTKTFQYENRLIYEKIIADSDGNMLLSGSLHKSNKLLISKWSSDGIEIWKKAWGVDSAVTGIAVDESNNIFITGYTEGEFEGFTNSGEFDCFLSKFSFDGTLQWTKQWGTDKKDISRAVTVDRKGNIFITGNVVTVSGKSNIFLKKFDGDGSEVWTQQIGSTVGSGIGTGSRAYSLTTDSEGSVYLTGGTIGPIDNSREYTGTGNDIFIAKWTKNSELMWIEHWGSDEDDEAFGIVLDATDNIFITGYTEGSLDGNTVPEKDYSHFLTKLIPQ